MKNKRGFTLIEILAVIIMIGIIAIVAIPSITKYLGASKNTTYSSYEKTMEDAARNRTINCITNNEDCDLPEGDAQQKVFLDTLIEEGYLDNMKDPDSRNFCQEGVSYVSIKGNNALDYEYKACLYCGSYNTDNSNCKKYNKTDDADPPVCGNVVGASTIWTNENRTISVDCSDEKSGCELPTFSKTFASTVKNGIGKVTIIDKNGNSTACNVNAFVDKTAPTCVIDVSGEFNQNSGWYIHNAVASLTNVKDGVIENGKSTESDVATYGMGTSIKNRDYNKITTYNVMNGITTVIGYVKDNASNEGLCSKEVKVGLGNPKFDLYYGYKIFPGTNTPVLTDITKSGTNLTTTSNTPKITFNNLSKYKDVEKVRIVLNDEIYTSTTATIKSGQMTKTGLMQQGSKEILFLIPKGTYESFEIRLGEITNRTYNINRIELLTKDGTAWTNENIVLYVEPEDKGVRSSSVSFDNGSTWTTTFHKTISTIEENSVITKNALGMQSEPTTYKTMIDKSIPTVSVVAKKKTNSSNVNTATYTNVGLNYIFSKNNVGPSGAQIYYCKDAANTCNPTIAAESGTSISNYNEETTNYYIRYMITNPADTKSNVDIYSAKFDTVKPQCTYSNLTTINITKEATLKLTCTDTLSGLVSKTIKTSDFTLSNDSISIKSISQKNVTNGIEVSLVLKADKKGDTAIEFKANTFSDNAENTNNSTSKTINVNTTFNITLDSQDATSAGTTNIYESYQTGWYSNSQLSASITKITNPSKNGYVFAGYYTQTNGGGTQVIDASGNIIAGNTLYTENATVYAKYTECGNGYYCSGGSKTACPAGTYGNGKTTESTQSGACTTCEKGYYCAGGTARVGCGDGKYNDLTGQSAASACKNITAGCYGSSGTSACPNSCSGRTKYSAAGASACSTVSSGYYTTGCDSSGNKCTGQSQCTAGNYCASGVSTACGAGKYSAAGATACSSISAGCYGTSAGSACPNSCSGRTKYSAAGASACSTVSSGYYTTGCDSSGNKCTGQSQCTAGNYCANGVSTACGAGKYSAAGATTCSSISAGCYGTSGGSACPNACSGRTKYSAAGASSCSTASSGYYTTGCDSSGNKCTGQTKCVAGNYCANGVSTACGGGKYSAAGATTCTNISAGCYGTSASTACPNSCTGRTKYSGAGASSCSTVSSGYYTTGCNSSNNNCTGQTKCVAGNYCVNGESKACGNGKYSGAGATTCQSISAGCYGASASSACPASCTGRTKYSGSGATSCSTVSSGYYTTGCNSSNNNCTGQAKCTAGNYCTNGVSNKCETYYYSGDGATSCYDNTTPTIYDYTSTNVKDTLTNMTICNFGTDTGSGLKQVEYYFSCNTTHKTATISGGCATITLSSPCSGAIFYYRIRDDRNWTGWKSASNFGAYFLLSRIYNKLLMYNPAYNGTDNITFHINRINGNLAARLTEVGTTAINNSSGVSNDEIVKRMYRGVLGREPSSGEVSGHVNNLNNGRTRVQVLGDFINSNEAKNIRSAWGY